MLIAHFNQNDDNIFINEEMEYLNISFANDKTFWNMQYLMEYLNEQGSDNRRMVTMSSQMRKLSGIFNI